MILQKQADLLRRSAYEKRSVLEMIDDPATQRSFQAVFPSSFGGEQQEEQQQPLPPPSSMNPGIGQLLGIQDGGSLISEAMCSIPPTNYQYQDKGMKI